MNNVRYLQAIVLKIESTNIFFLYFIEIYMESWKQIINILINPRKVTPISGTPCTGIKLLLEFLLSVN